MPFDEQITGAHSTHVHKGSKKNGINRNARWQKHINVYLT